MILFAFAQWPISGEPWLVVDAGRWVLHAGWNDTPGVAVCEQRRSKDTGEWYDCGYYVNVSLASWRIGYDYSEYDGSHETIALGFVRVEWCLGLLDPVMPARIRRALEHCRLRAIGEVE